MMVPIQVIRWYRMQCYDGTDSCAIVVPIRRYCQQGINIVKIEAYEYSDAPGIKHLFFYFAEDSKKAIPYFMLDSEVWEKILLCIMQI